MTDTFVSEHVDEALYELSWDTASGTPDQWSILLKLFPALTLPRFAELTDGASCDTGAPSSPAARGGGS